MPQVSNKAMLVMVHQLDSERRQVTVLNFSAEPISGSVRSEHLPPAPVVVDMITDRRSARSTTCTASPVTLDPHEGLSLLVEPPVDLSEPPTS